MMPGPPADSPIRLRPWQRLGVRIGALFLAVTLLAVGLAGAVIYRQQKRDLEETLGALLLNIARTGALVIDPQLHAEIQSSLAPASDAYRRVRAVLAAVQDENRIDTPIYTLTDYDEAARQARFMVTSRGPGGPGEPYPLVAALIEPLRRSFRESVATHTPVYRNQSGTWITAFAPIRDATGRPIAVLDVDYRVDVYLRRLAVLRQVVVGASFVGALAALVLGVLVARRVTEPIRTLAGGVARVAAGDLSRPLPVRARDEVGQLTQAFNAMLDGLRQRDFIRDTLGRYVSPEVAKTLLESPEGLRFGGEKREVTVLMSDLRGYTRFAEQGDPQRVMEMLNDYLARMADIIIGYGGTINEFIGDAIFAVFGAPLSHADHVERAAAAALSMQRAMTDLNRANVERGRPRFEMGIGVNTGEAVVGNIGSEQRAKYAVVGSAVNVASRVEGATVGGQVFLSAASYDRIREIAEVGDPVPISVKGLAEPLVVYELNALAGRFAQRLPEEVAGSDRQVDVSLPLECWVIDGKAVRAESLTGIARRLGPREVAVEMPAPLPLLTNVKLRINYPGLGYDSGDLYGKVLGEDAAGRRLTRIRLTSVDEADRKVLEMFLEG